MRVFVRKYLFCYNMLCELKDKLWKASSIMKCVTVTNYNDIYSWCNRAFFEHWTFSEWTKLLLLNVAKWKFSQLDYIQREPNVLFPLKSLYSLKTLSKLEENRRIPTGPSTEYHDSIIYLFCPLSWLVMSTQYIICLHS
jgi:hypothetical protein